MANKKDPANTKQDSQAYLNKKQSLRHTLTIYGRLAVLEALQNKEISTTKLHLADSNRETKALEDITMLASQKGTEIVRHSRAALSRISKNRKQDQGIALDIKPKGFCDFDPTLLADKPDILALENITNPQNLGMIIRSVCASTMSGLMLPQSGCAKLDALVIKASAGTLFNARIFRCDDLCASLKYARSLGWRIVGLDLNTDHSFAGFDRPGENPTIFVLGNESEGLSEEIKNLCTHRVKIPMQNGVDSLNVAVTAGLIAFRHQL